MTEILEYTKLARYYDAFFTHTKDYEKEASEIKQLVTKYKIARGNTLLDVACGSGRHLLYLKKWYRCTGIDLNQEMLDIAKKLVQGVSFKKANMIKLKTSKKFDIVTCLFSAIGYVKTYKNLNKTIKNLNAALKPGGILIIDGWFDKKGWRTGYAGIRLVDTGKMKIALAGSSKRSGMISRTQQHWLIAEENKGIKYFVDTQEHGLFERDKFLKILRSNGFKARIIKSPMPGRPRYLAIKP